MDNFITVHNGECHNKLEPYREKFNLSITGRTFFRIKNLVGNMENDEEMMIRLCEELEKQRVCGLDTLHHPEGITFKRSLKLQS
jgi:hypothetical protein